MVAYRVGRPPHTALAVARLASRGWGVGRLGALPQPHPMAPLFASQSLPHHPFSLPLWFSRNPLAAPCSTATPPSLPPTGLSAPATCPLPPPSIIWAAGRDGDAAGRGVEDLFTSGGGVGGDCWSGDTVAARGGAGGGMVKGTMLPRSARRRCECQLVGWGGKVGGSVGGRGGGGGVGEGEAGGVQSREGTPSMVYLSPVIDPLEAPST